MLTAANSSVKQKFNDDLSAYFPEKPMQDPRPAVDISNQINSAVDYIMGNIPEAQYADFLMVVKNRLKDKLIDKTLTAEREFQERRSLLDQFS